jgi:cytochrome c oxidase subunit 1
VGFLLLHLEAGRAIMARYGSLAKAMALPLLFTGSQKDVPPPAIVAATATTVFNAIGLVPGASILIISLVNLMFPAFAIDPLLAKNMIYFFGHVFINASIYMAVIAVYEIMPDYTGRPWKTSRVFAGAWFAILFMVMAVYPHHLLQDTVMPAWALVMGQIVSYASGIPVIAVTAFSLLAMIYRSGIKWDLASALLTAGVFGWAAGAVPAIIDATISVNKVMHNTLWVPGHFHMYLLLGQVAMVFGFMAWLTRDSRTETFSGPGLWAFLAYFLGSLGFVLALLVAGASSIPRRWAVHLPEWMPHDRIGSLFGAIIVLGAFVFVARYLGRLALSGRS